MAYSGFDCDKIEIQPELDGHKEETFVEQHVSVDITDDENEDIGGDDDIAHLRSMPHARARHVSFGQSDSSDTGASYSDAAESLGSAVRRLWGAAVYCCSSWRHWYHAARKWCRDVRRCCTNRDGPMKIHVEWLLLALTLVAFLTFAMPSKCDTRE